MSCALWRNQSNRAAKLHLKFSVLRQVPGDAIITAANCCESKTLRRTHKVGDILIGDRYHGLGC